MKIKNSALGFARLKSFIFGFFVIIFCSVASASSCMDALPFFKIDSRYGECYRQCKQDFSTCLIEADGNRDKIQNCSKTRTACLFDCENPSEPPPSDTTPPTSDSCYGACSDIFNTCMSGTEYDREAQTNCQKEYHACKFNCGSH